MKEPFVEPSWCGFNEDLEVPEETRQENAADRIRFSGPGGELLRRMYVERLRVHWEIHYEHGSIADLAAVCTAFDLLDQGSVEQSNGERSQASLVEAFLATLGFCALKLLESGLQQRRGCLPEAAASMPKKGST